MAMGSLTLACALLFAAPPGQPALPPEPYYLNESQFQIPIKVNQRASELKELLLYVSTDKGQSYSVASRVTPDKAFFVYTAPSDGTYWFTIAVVDRQNRQDPVDVYQAPVMQWVIVDTRKPEIRVTRAEQRDGLVQVQWDVREEYPDLATFRLEYRMPEVPGAQWTPVNVTPALQGEAAFRLPGPGAVQVRILVTDRAGNVGQGVKDISAAGPAVAVVQPGPVSGGSAAVSYPPTAGGTVPPPPGASDESPNPSQLTPPPPAGGDYRSPPPPDTAAWGANSRTPVANAIPVPSPAPSGQPLAVAQADPSRYQQIQQTSAPGERISSGVAYSGNGYAGVRANLPPVKVVNKPQPKLDFQVGKYGPSGLGAVEVYVTTDDGANWTLSQTDRNVTLPTVTDSRGSTPVSGSVVVDLKKEGVVYGYYIVVKSRAGLGKKAPEAGTAPQVRLELDITPPSVELYKLEPAEGRTDTLMLSWKATDKNLASECVTIEWAEQKDGQWKVIGTANMPNTGRYPWQVPANVPPTVYLRLAVRDTAGNLAVAQTDNPVVVDLSTPEVGPVSVKEDR